MRKDEMKIQSCRFCAHAAKASAQPGNPYGLLKKFSDCDLPEFTVSLTDVHLIFCQSCRIVKPEESKAETAEAAPAPASAWRKRHIFLISLWTFLCCTFHRVTHSDQQHNSDFYHRWILCISERQVTCQSGTIHIFLWPVRHNTLWEDMNIFIFLPPCHLFGPSSHDRQVSITCFHQCQFVFHFALVLFSPQVWHLMRLDSKWKMRSWS